MDHFVATALFYLFFTPAFWLGLRSNVGTLGRVPFYLTVQTVTLITWFVIAENATHFGDLSASTVAIDGLVALFSGYLTGVLSGAYARYLNRRMRFAWLVFLPFALIVMAFVPKHESRAVRV